MPPALREVDYSDGASEEAMFAPEGYYPASELNATTGDCDDATPEVNPGADEVCGDGVDNNCDGNIDEECDAPDAPANLAAVAGDGSVSLSWDPAATAESYNVYYAGSAGVSPSANDGVFDTTQTSYIHEGLTNGEVYFYVVTAVNGAGEGPASTEASAPPQAAVVPPLPV